MSESFESGSLKGAERWWAVYVYMLWYMRPVRPEGHIVQSIAQSMPPPRPEDPMPLYLP